MRAARAGARAGLLAALCVHRLQALARPPREIDWQLCTSYRDRCIAVQCPACRVLRPRWSLPTIPCLALCRELATLRSSCQSALATMRMPTTRNEDFRFTDVTPILQSTLQPASPAAASEDSIAAAVARHDLKQPAAAVVVVVDGVVHDTLGCAGCLPTGVYVGGLEAAPKDVISFELVSFCCFAGNNACSVEACTRHDAHKRRGGGRPHRCLL